jgi:hypothetical protein
MIGAIQSSSHVPIEEPLRSNGGTSANPRAEELGAEATHVDRDGVERRIMDARVETLAKQLTFLKAYSECGVISAAALLAGIDRNNHYDWLKDKAKYPEYAAAFEDAHETACDSLESEMIRRGRDGVDKPVFYQGVRCGEIREYSDAMLTLALKSRRPEKFKDRSQVEQTGESKVIILPSNDRDEAEGPQA